MPIPFTTQLTQAVETALEKSGVIPKSEAVSALNEAGADVRRLATELANLIFSAKDPTKLKAIQHAFALHGVNLETTAERSSPVINFNILSENTNLNNLFAPERK